MAKVRLLHSVKFSTDRDNIFALLNGLDCPILECSFSNNTITLNLEDKATISFSGDGDYFRPINITYNGVTNSISGGNLPKTPCDIIIAYSDSFFYFKIASLAGWSNQKGCAFFYESINDESYFGYIEGTANASITDIQLKDSNNVIYSRPLMMNYTKEIGMIDFIDHDLLVGAGITIIDDKGFIACSTITNNSVLTINGKNYYAMGTNTLVEVEA